MLLTTLADVSHETLGKVAEELRKFGAEVTWQSDNEGVVEHLSGRARFLREADIVQVWLESDAGHFTRRMLVGGIRQLVEEAKGL